MRLFYAPGACSLASQIVLQETGFPHVAERVDLESHTLEDGGDFFVVNPKGQVPVLELDDGSLLTENVAVLQYLADLNPTCQLAPPNGTLERYRLQEWLGYISAEVHQAFGPLFKNGSAQEKRHALDNLQKNLDYIESMLQGRIFLTGDQFTEAEAYLYVMLGLMERVGLSLSRWPRLTALHLRISARPAVQHAESEELETV